jgi:prophage regulatory protein
MATRELWRLPKVESVTGKKRARIYEEMAEGRFPKSVRLGNKSVAWISTEIEQHVDEIIAASRTAHE